MTHLTYMTDLTTVQVLLIFFAGLLGGFASSAPLGPINLWIVDFILEKPKASLRTFLAGVIACDAAFASLACWGYYAFLNDSTLGKILGIAGGIFLITLGGIGLHRHSLRNAEHKTMLSTGNPLRDFCMGVFIVGSNPGFLMFWVFVVEVLEHQLNLHVQSFAVGLFVLGIILGDMLWFALLRVLVHRGRESFQAHWLRILRFGIAGTFVVCGFITVLHNGQALQMAARTYEASGK